MITEKIPTNLERKLHPVPLPETGVTDTNKRSICGKPRCTQISSSFTTSTFRVEVEDEDKVGRLGRYL